MSREDQAATWVHKAKWDASTIHQYGLHCATWYVRAVPERIDCADMAIRLVVEFAEKNQLPVVLTGAGRLFDSRTFGSNRHAFEEQARHSIRAKDLQLPTNTRLVGRDPHLVRPGHILLYPDPRSSTWHTQIVTRSSASKDWISILQGDVHRGAWDSFRYLTGRDPKPWIPQPLATGAFTGGGRQYHQHYDEHRSWSLQTPWSGIVIMEWNFNGWNHR